MPSKTIKFTSHAQLIPAKTHGLLNESEGNRDVAGLGIADRAEAVLPVSFDVVLAEETDELEDHVRVKLTPT